MAGRYSSNLKCYVGADGFPLWVESVQRRHPERLFHDHDYTEITLVTQGHAVHLWDGASAPVEAGDLLVTPPGVFHAYDQTEDMFLVNVLYDHRKLVFPPLDGASLPLFRLLFPADGTEMPRQVEPLMRLGAEELAGVVETLKVLERELKTRLPGASLRSLALFLDFALRLARLSDFRQPRRRARFQIGDAMAHMHDNFHRHVGMDALAKVAKMSKRNFFRQFRESVGQSPLEFLSGLRLRQAAELLQGTDKSVAEIAEACGFCDSNYLCREFRAQMKTHPTPIPPAFPASPALGGSSGRLTRRELF